MKYENELLLILITVFISESIIKVNLKFKLLNYFYCNIENSEIYFFK